MERLGFWDRNMWDIDMGHTMQSLRFHSSHGEGKTRDQGWRYLVDREVRDIGKGT